MAGYSEAVRVSPTGRAYVDVPTLLRQPSVQETIRALRSKLWRETAGSPSLQAKP